MEDYRKVTLRMPSDEERVVSVIPNVTLTLAPEGTRTGHLHSLVLTDQRVIFARLTKSRLAELNRLPKPGKKRLTQIGAKTPALGLLQEQYLAMPPAQALAEHEANFAVDRDLILKVRIKFTGGEIDTTTEALSFKTEEDTYRVILTSGSQTRRALREAGML